MLSHSDARVVRGRDEKALRPWPTCFEFDAQCKARAGIVAQKIRVKW